MLRPIVLCLLLVYSVLGEGVHHINWANYDSTLWEICEKNGVDADEAVVKAENAKRNLAKCSSDISLYAKRSAAKIDYVYRFNPYGKEKANLKIFCQNSDHFKKCFTDYLIDLEPCSPLNRNQTFSENMEEIQRFIDKIFSFICENEGNHIISFMSKGGPECIAYKMKYITECVQSKYRDSKTLSLLFDHLEEEDLEEEEINNLNFTGKDDSGFNSTFDDLNDCRTVYQIRKCIVEELTTCSSSTPAKFVDSVFNLIHELTCGEYNMKDIDPDYNSGTYLFTSFFSVIISALTVLLMRTFNS